MVLNALQDKTIIEFNEVPTNTPTTALYTLVWNSQGVTGNRTQRFRVDRTIVISADSTGVFLTINGGAAQRILDFGTGLTFNSSTKTLTLNTAYIQQMIDDAIGGGGSPTPTPTQYNTLITCTDTTNGNVAQGVTFLGSLNDRFEFNSLSTGGATPASMYLAIGNSSNVVASVTFLDRYIGQRFSYRTAAGVVYNGSANVFTNNSTIVLTQ